MEFYILQYVCKQYAQDFLAGKWSWQDKKVGLPAISLYVFWREEGRDCRSIA